MQTQFIDCKWMNGWLLISAYRGLRLGLERHEPVLSQKAVSKAGFWLTVDNYHAKSNATAEPQTPPSRLEMCIILILNDQSPKNLSWLCNGRTSQHLKVIVPMIIQQQINQASQRLPVAFTRTTDYDMNS